MWGKPACFYYPSPFNSGNPEGSIAHFINDPDTQQWYKDYIKLLLNYENTATGKQYKNDPAIFSWEIMNKERGQKAIPENDCGSAHWYSYEWGSWLPTTRNARSTAVISAG